MPLPADVTAALVRSRFGALPDDALARLTAGAIRVEVPAGTGLIEPGTVPRLHLMVAGVAKTYLIAPNGRQATVRHARSGKSSPPPPSATSGGSACQGSARSAP